LPDDLRGKLPDGLVDELLAGARTEEEIVGPGGLLSLLTKGLVERAMEVELTDHLGYELHQEPPDGAGNTRNGSTAKSLVTEHGPPSAASAPSQPPTGAEALRWWPDWR
jgi:Transposase, Mutator family